MAANLSRSRAGSTEAFYSRLRAAVTGALLIALPTVMSDLYGKTEPSALTRSVITSGITADAILLADWSRCAGHPDASKSARIETTATEAEGRRRAGRRAQ